MRKLVAAALLAASACAAPRLPERAASPADTLTLVIAGTTDVHGWLRGWDYYANAPDPARGLARAATIVDSLRTAHPGRVLLVDAGDDLQGTPINHVALRDTLLPNPVAAAMNTMRYDAAVIGNHEFNFGVPYLDRVIGQAAFPFLAANVYRLDGTPAYTPWVAVERGGARIAIVGATTPGSMIWDRDKLAGRLAVRDIVPAVRDAVGRARASGADAVVVVLHSGLSGAPSYDTAATGVGAENVTARVAREVPGIDLIVFGHSHRELADSVIGGALLTQPRNAAGSVSVSRLHLVRDDAAGTSRWRVAARDARVVPTRDRAEHPAVVAAVADAHARAVRYATEPVGSTPVAWRADSARVRDTPIIDLLLEVQRRAAGADLAATNAFSLDAGLGPGPITMGDIARLYPYENNVLRAVRITGRQLREYLEFSARYFREDATGDSLVDPSIPGFNFDIVAGVEYVLDLTRPIGSRVTTLARAGRPVADTDTFTLAVHDYRQSGGGGYPVFRHAPLVSDRQQVIRELLIEEVRRRGTIRPEDYFTPNWTLAPDSLVGAAYRSMRRLPYDRPRPTPARTP